ncbi:hypothetical protein AVEN_15435-1 [Araneus ventricosus]|uniref:Uncharacterized protein n=1 Tax=Araneus ventricosus TaxID=182803 RepID=A0A4Y2CV89_ARAVE|nr:hypothetical protein AVEN_15435-1 [Araneus ventricosus]
MEKNPFSKKREQKQLHEKNKRAKKIFHSLLSTGKNFHPKACRPSPPPLQNLLPSPRCRSACEATDKVRGCGGANTCILRPQGMIEAAVSRKNMWLVRVAAVPLGRFSCPSVPFCCLQHPVLVEEGCGWEGLVASNGLESMIHLL